MKKNKDDSELDLPVKTTTTNRPKLSEDKICWASFVAEADVYMRQYDYAKAVEFYTKALQIEPDNVHVLTYRAQARNIIGDSKKSEEDADKILSIEPKSQAGHMCKANALYNMGEFEFALVWFVRGQRVPLAELDMLQEFKHGEFRCRSAIERAIESFDVPKLKLILDNKKLVADKFHLQNRKKNNANSKGAYYNGGSYSRSKAARFSLTGNNVQVAQNLLEELFDDYVFLRDLETSPSIRNAQDPILNLHISDGLNYLEDRLEFWRAINPKAVNDTATIESPTKNGKQTIRAGKHLKESLKPLQVLPKIGDY